MAIQIDTLIDPTTGTPVTGAYCAVDQLNLNKRDQTGQLVVQVWRGSAQRAANRTALTQYSYAISPADFATYFAPLIAVAGNSAPSIYTGAYAFLKARPEWTGAVDV